MMKMILFDVDGVLLSEEHYFDASALTLWEMLISPNYLALAPEKFKTDYSDAEIKRIREMVFEHDHVLKFMKSRGLNSNWDMTYLAFSFQLIHLLSQIKEKEYVRITKWCQAPISREVLVEIGEVLAQYNNIVETGFELFVHDFEKSDAMKLGLFGYLNVLAEEKLGVETNIFSEKGELWSVCEHVSQEWYVGDDNVLASTGNPSVQTGKQGFLVNETTVAPINEIEELFQVLLASGCDIGIATGRPELEVVQPFEHLKWLQYFDENRIVTADDVLKAESEQKELKSLSKPHPYTYMAALRGRHIPVQECLNTPLPIENGDNLLIVGDSLADLLAARQMGCRFAAVLTGLSGKDARSEFEEYHADFILDTVLDVKKIIEEEIN